MAVETSHAHIGALVTCNSYRNPNLLADMARTIDHLSGGRFVLGIGSGWFERDYDGVRLRVRHRARRGCATSRDALPMIMERLRPAHAAAARARPDPHRRLRPEGHAAAHRRARRRVELVRPARRATRRRTAILDEWCAKLDRNPRQIERTVGIQATEIDDWQAYLDAGAEHLIVMAGPPFDLDPVRQLLEIARELARTGVTFRTCHPTK